MFFSEFKEKSDFFEVKISEGLRNYVNRRREGSSKTFYEKDGERKLEILSEKDLRGPFSFLFPERDTVEGFLKEWPQATAVFRIISRDIEILSPLGDRVQKEEYLETFKVSLKRGKNLIESSGFSFQKGGLDFKKIRELFSSYFKKAENPVKVEGGKYPVLFRGQAAGLIIHEFFGHLLEADISEKIKSPFVKERVGEKVLNENITIEDISEKPDDEGIFKERVILVERGVLKGFLSDFSYSLKGFKPGGRGRRENFRVLPLPRQNLLVLKSNKTEREKSLLGRIKRGFLVERIKTGLLDYKSFDYEFYVTASFFIENGEISSFTDNFLIKGNFLNDFMKISEFSDSVYCNGYEGVCTKEEQRIRIGYKTPSFIVENLVIKSII